MLFNLKYKIFRIILGTLLVPLLGDLCILLFYGILFNESKFIDLLIISYIVALSITGIPTFIFRLIIEFTTQKLESRLFFSFIFAIGLGIFLSKGEWDNGIWLFSSIIAVMLTEWILYRHIKKYDKKQIDKKQMKTTTKEIRLNAELGSSGVWNSQGQMLTYEQANLPYYIFQRIEQWHNHFEEKFMPYSKHTEQDWQYHTQEEMAIARLMQEFFKDNAIIKIFRNNQWISIEEID